MIKKQLYIIPETEVLEVRFEENILSGPGSGYNRAGNAGNTLQEDDEYSYSF